MSDDDPASFSLKCVPCFFNDRKWANLAFAIGSGEPGGDGGISKFGTGGSVKSWISARDVEKGDDCLSGVGSFARCTSRAWGCDGPRTGPAGSTFVAASGRELPVSTVV